MSQTEAISGTSDSQRLHDAIARDYIALRWNVACLLKKHQGPLSFDQRTREIDEIVNEAVKRALERAEDFDPRQSAVAWLTGFAINVLREQHPGRCRRPMNQSDVGEDAWQAAMRGAFAHQDGETGPDASRIPEALGRLTADQQRVLQLGLVQELDSAALARELGVSTSGAARVRQCRALDALRKCFKQLNCAGAKEQLP